jgi:hypothetical protein
MAANTRDRRNRNAHAVLKPIPLEPLASSPRISSIQAGNCSNLAIMASNSDAAFVADADVDQALRSRQSQSKAPVFRPRQSNNNNNNKKKSRVRSPGGESDSDHEDAPLLSPTEQDYGSAHGSNDGNSSELEWAGEADFAGLPWWKRPSVRTHTLSPSFYFGRRDRIICILPP